MAISGAEAPWIGGDRSCCDFILNWLDSDSVSASKAMLEYSEKGLNCR